MTKLKITSCHIETELKCAININFRAKILVPGKPSVTKRIAHETLPRVGLNDHTPLTLSADLVEYRR